MFYLNEKQKMLANLLHDPMGGEIDEDRTAVLDLCSELNRLRPSEIEKRNELLRKILPHAQEPFTINPPFTVDIGYNTYIGSNFIAGYDLMIFDYARVTIGERVTIGSRCMMATSMHPWGTVKRNTYVIYILPITIGNDVWIGSGVKIIGGVTIGNNVVIESGSVVTKNIPDNSYASGNPCRVVRSLV